MVSAGNKAKRLSLVNHTTKKFIIIIIIIREFSETHMFGQLCDLVPAKIIAKLLIQEIREILDDSLNREVWEE